MIRLVLDTNILISALLTPGGFPAQVLSLSLVDPDVQLCLSAEIYSEYEEVLRRPKFQRTEHEIVAILRAIRERAIWVKPTETIRICSDPDDDVFLECAQAANAHYLVTGNIKHFPPSWEGTKIATSRQFVESLV
jgi:putative PIN family toxin of toxin-antitoxin system